MSQVIECVKVCPFVWVIKRERERERERERKRVILIIDRENERERDWILNGSLIYSNRGIDSWVDYLRRVS